MGTAYLDTEGRIRQWLDNTPEMLGRVIPSLLKECEHLRRETVELRSYVALLQEQVNRLERERGAIARTAEARLTEIGRVATDAIDALKAFDQVNDSDQQSSRSPRDGAVRRRARKA